MDTAKLVNWRILTNQKDYESALNIVAADMSNAMIVNSTTDINISNTNIEGAQIQAGLSGHIDISESYGAVQYLAPVTLSTDNSVALNANKLYGSRFVFLDPASSSGASFGIFSNCTDNIFKSSVFRHLGEQGVSSNLGLRTIDDAGAVSGNDFSGSQFDSIGLNDLDSITPIVNNKFDNCTFMGIFDVALASEFTDNTNTFTNCSFINNSTANNSGIDIQIPGFDFTGSKFNNISINTVEVIFEGCSFNNCLGFDGDGYVELTPDILISMAKKIGREYTFYINQKAYTVPAE